jgi:phage portal protein BeeE
VRRGRSAIVYTARDGSLSPGQLERLKSELEPGFQGAAHAGRPLLLEGGLDWKSMSLRLKDIDFIEAKHVAAREIAKLEATAQAAEARSFPSPKPGRP